MSQNHRVFELLDCRHGGDPTRSQIAQSYIKKGSLFLKGLDQLQNPKGPKSQPKGPKSQPKGPKSQLKCPKSHPKGPKSQHKSTEALGIHYCYALYDLLPRPVEHEAIMKIV